jgi:Raf kinase inhibitor-like YbhB/YbcL family protein
MMNLGVFFVIIILFILVFTFFPFGKTAFATNKEQFILKSPSFAEGSLIPKKFSCDGENISPELTWENLPEGTVNLVLICEDPDAPVGIWTHWILYNIPVTLNSLPENMDCQKELIAQDKILVGMNDFKKLGYGGPCPPPGKPHRYFFRLLALNTKLDLKTGLNRDQVLAAIKGKIIKEAQLVGLYSRKKIKT